MQLYCFYIKQTYFLHNLITKNTILCWKDNCYLIETLIWFLFSVFKITLKEGDNATIFWSAPYFPEAGAYTIYHTNKANRSIIQVNSNNVTTQNRKYEYLSQPLNSTNITFVIKNITVDDAGYYAGGIKAEDAWSGGGVVLIVPGKSF